MSRGSETGRRRFQKARRKIDKKLQDISEDTRFHFEVLLDAVKDLLALLKEQRVEEIIELCEDDPNVNKQYGDTAEGI